MNYSDKMRYFKAAEFHYKQARENHANGNFDAAIGHQKVAHEFFLIHQAVIFYI